MGRPRVSSYCKANHPRALFAPARSFISRYFLRSRDARLFAVLTLAAALCGCSASNVIGLYTADYRDTTANAGDAQLLLNILRAKDNLPIHFYDLAIIHGSIQLTASNTTNVPFANFNAPGAIASNVAPVVSAQSAPSFDVSTSDTQDFTRGILTQIDPRVVKALFDQGVDPRIMLLLFFSEYRERDRVWLNTMACDPSDAGHPEKDPQGGCLNQVYAYLSKIDRLLDKAQADAGLRPPLQAKLQANIYYALSPVGDRLLGAWTLDQLDVLRQVDTTKYKLINNRLYSISPDARLAICYVRGAKLHLLIPSPIGDSACTQSEVIVYEPPTKRNVGLALRSTYDIIQFLGQVLRFQQEKGNNRCLTLDDSRSCDTGNVLFQVNAPVGTPVIGTRYADAWYALYDRFCDKNHQTPCDYSIQVLAILELLLNENRQAKDIISTPRVQVVQ